MCIFVLSMIRAHEVQEAWALTARNENKHRTFVATLQRVCRLLRPDFQRTQRKPRSRPSRQGIPPLSWFGRRERHDPCHEFGFAAGVEFPVAIRRCRQPELQRGIVGRDIRMSAQPVAEQDALAMGGIAGGAEIEPGSVGA
jgi:hypothetical protein